MCLAPCKQSRQRPILPALSLSGSTDSGPRAPLPARPARNTLPEIFTFEVESVQRVGAPRRNPAGGRSRRPRKVLYPAKVRRYLPPPETDRALRWLYGLCVVLLLQVCAEEPEVPAVLQGPPAAPLGKSLQLAAEHSLELPAAWAEHSLELPAAWAERSLQLPAAPTIHSAFPNQTLDISALSHRALTCNLPLLLLKIQR
ncbi:radiation-inducible immediate-early gene IEX-1 [Xenopus tropicalis]|uniref:Radiation-inducible immediate-early gene IEX-1 n=1 Tax=Xenopus tropicalis TaxID=8364 RepID=A0A8J0R7T8_XENTR|nr:radiation-inducible immediate-early gene IEX-1 [Xenopus tropicalis]|eukprot:XP_004919864.1 PREDICTED: radiation-inducible immediate-early gene IEX-1 [Xenopus tropicalis]